MANKDYTRGSINIRTPEKLVDVEAMIDSLIEGNPVIFNLERLTKDSAQRVMDFISGAVYALRGTITPIERCRFLASPEGLPVQSNKNED